MGRQTRFYATPVDLEELLTAIMQKGGVLLNHYGEEITLDDSMELIRGYYVGEIEEIYPPRASPDIVRRKLDAIAIPDAQLVIGHSKDGTPFLDQSNSEVIEFSMNRRWSPPYSPRPTADPLPGIENGYEYGRFWYAKEGFDRAQGKWVQKPHENELTKLFNFIHRTIRKTYRMDTSHSEYIGPDAYKGYLNGTFVPCQGYFRYIFPKDGETSEE